MGSGQTDKNSVRVTIYNHPYTLRVAGDPGQVEDLARQVDSLMESIASRGGNTDGARVAVLACLHLADRLRSLERELSALKQRVDEKSERFALLLDQALESRE